MRQAGSRLARLPALAPVPPLPSDPQVDDNRTRMAAPVMSLSGHSAPVLAVDFAPDGETLLSASKDRRVFLWRTSGDCVNVAALSGHKAAVTDARWSQDGAAVYSCSADKTVASWDAVSGEVLRRLEGHTSVVNALCPARRGPPLLVTASDDGTARVWDARKKRAALVLSHDGGLPVTACAFADDSMGVMTAGVEGMVRVWDLRRGEEGAPEVRTTLPGHTNIVTHLSLNKHGSFLASNSMDGTVRVWDVRPFAPAAAAAEAAAASAGGSSSSSATAAAGAVARCRAVMRGATHGREQSLVRCCWEPSGDRVAAGGADRCVSVWDARSGARVMRLPGHKGTVQGVAWSPSEPLIASCGNDGEVFLGEVPDAGEEVGEGAGASA